MIFFYMIVYSIFAGMVLTIYWTVAAQFPNVSLGGWIVVAAYLVVALAVPTIVAPFVTRVVNLSRYTAWQVVMALWVSLTAIAGLLAWPIIGSYIKPLFVGSVNV